MDFNLTFTKWPTTKWSDPKLPTGHYSPCANTWRSFRPIIQWIYHCERGNAPICKSI